MPTEHRIQCRQRPVGLTRAWTRLDIALDLPPGEVVALKRTGRAKAVVMVFTPYRRWWHTLLGRPPRDRRVRAREIIDGRYVSFLVRSVDASSAEQAMRAKVKAFLQQIVDAQAGGVVRSYDLDTGRYIGAEA